MDGNLGPFITHAVAHFIDKMIEPYSHGALGMLCFRKRAVATLTVIEISPLGCNRISVCSLWIHFEAKNTVVFKLELIGDTHTGFS